MTCIKFTGGADEVSLGDILATALMEGWQDRDTPARRCRISLVKLKDGVSIYQLARFSLRSTQPE